MVPEEINIAFLKKFQKLIIRHVRKSKRFIIICGGGRTARKYQKAARQVSKLTAEDLDWIGIHATRLNAHLLRTIFREHAYERVIKNPLEKIKTAKPVIIAAGWKPGCSTDYDAVLLAKNFSADLMLNITDLDYIYTKDPKIYRNAKIIKRMSWQQLRARIPKEWSPGLSAPFDPVAAREAEKIKLRLICCGKKIKNLDAIFSGKKFIGTIIE